MKNLLLCLALAYSTTLSAQSHTCCPSQPKYMFALTASEPFMVAHSSPTPWIYDQQRGTMIEFNTPDGKKASAYYVPAPEAATRAVLLFHEWWGLNDYIKREADKLQDSLGPVDVYAVDLYDGKIATNPAEASKYSSSLDYRRTDAIIQGLLAKAGKNRQIATCGWCLGGAFAFRASVLLGKEAYGCVMYYGFPEKDVKKIKPLETDVLYIRGTKDQFITEPMVNDFAAEIRTVGRSIEILKYPAVHAFANPSNPNYDQVATADALDHALKFLRKYLSLN